MSLIREIGKKGLITEGEHSGFFVRIEDDKANTGGYLILVFKDENVGFDSWVETEKDLEQYFHEAEWKIEWL